MRLLVTVGAVCIASMGFAQVYFDNFDRVDGPTLGADYDLIAGTSTGIATNMAAGMAASNNLSLVKSAIFTGPYDMTIVEADVSLADTLTTTAYVALALGHNGVNATGNGLFIKVQRQGISNFSHIGFYTGVGVNNAAAITGGGGNFVALTTTFSRAHMTVWASDATTINLGFDTDFDGIDDQVHTRTMVFPTLTVGDRVGLGIFGLAGRADNFQATVVPEPATLAALGLGALALMRRRRKA